MAERKFVLTFDANMDVSKVKRSVSEIQSVLNNLNLSKGIQSSASGTFKKLLDELDHYNSLTFQAATSMSDIKKADRSLQTILDLFEKINNIAAQIGADPLNFVDAAQLKKINSASKALNEAKEAMSNTALAAKKANLQEQFDKAKKSVENLNGKINNLNKDISAKKTKRSNIEASLANAKTELESFQEELRKLQANPVSLKTKTSTTKGVKTTDVLNAEEYENYKKQLDSVKNKIAELEKNKRQLDKELASTDTSKAEKELTELQNEADEATREMDELGKKIKHLKKDVRSDAIEKLRNELSDLTGLAKTEIPTSINKIEEFVAALTDVEKAKVASALDQMNQELSETARESAKAAEGIDRTEKEAEQLNRVAQDMDNLKNQVLDFFSITNTIQIFKNTVRKAFDTVKELDAVMTETAVVTDFTIGDMWEKLPIYSKQATALGVSIKDLYGATTLYYQQGLQTNDAMSVGVETMKMARIANMDATEATTAMTAALRGFNMEVNEMNAQRVNDVYSELAAITAADTNQIATAMSKTASIASSANMEFETTAALLAQIIETTQEAPETAGTAMKTIIARFTEVKQLFSEGMLTGKDGEGEEININKIDAALKSVGISLKDFLNGTKGIDDIFLELASKWDNLDLATQRYIATTAAGSRQQSRFIAMMSNYDRTMELVGAANNSAGASQEQFNKTLESLDAKLQRLKNAWDQFVMGLANNEVIKLGVDTLTGILETVNKLTESLSGGNGLVKSLVSLITVIGALKGGASIFNSLFGYKKQIGEIDLGNGQKGSITLGKMSKKTQAEGEEAAAGLAFGLQKGIKQWQSNGLGAALKGFFGEGITTNVTEAYQQIDSKKLYNALGNMELGLAEDDLSQRAMDVRLLNEQIADGTIDIDIATKKYKEFGGSLEDVIVPAKAFSFNFQNIGVAAAGAGSAISLLGNLFEKLGAEDFGKGLKMVGSGITGIGSTMAMVAPLLTKLGIGFNTLGLTVKGTVVASFGALGTAIAPVAIGLAAIIGLFIAIRNASPEYQLKQATEAANKTAEAADAAAEAYNNLKSSLESIEGKEAALEELAVGTQEWKNAVSELNDEILNLLALYPELSSFVTSDDGILSLSEEGRKFVLDQQYQQKQNTQAANVAAQITKQQAQQAVEFSDLNEQLKIHKFTYIKDEQGNIVDVKDDIDREATELLAKELAAGRLEADSPELAFLKDVKGGFEEFLEFGRSLNNIDKANDVFTDSLMNSAVVNADVSEEFKKQIGGMYDTQAVTKLTQNEENLIGVLSEDEKKEYARRMGYTHKRGNQYLDAEGNQFKVTAQQVKSQLAAMRAQDQLTENIVNMESVFANLQSSSNTLEKSFANVISKADGAGLTLKDISKNKDLFKETYEDSTTTDDYGKVTFNNSELQELYNKVSDFYDPETFYRIFSDAQAQGERRVAQSEEKLKSAGLGDLYNGLFKDAQIDSGSLFDIAQNLYDVLLTSGKNASIGLGEQISEVLSNPNLEPEQAQKFAEALDLITWTDTESIEGLSDILIQLGFDSKAVGLDIEKLENDIKAAAKATQLFDLEKMREEVKATEDLIKDLEGREDTERVFNKEARDKIVSADPSLADKFVATGIDEFVYVGNSIADLIVALNSNTSALLGEYSGQVSDNAATSQKWQDFYDKSPNYYSTIQDIVDSGSMKDYYEPAIRKFALELGVVDSEEHLNELDTTALVEAITLAYEKFGSEEARKTNFEAKDSLISSYYDSLSNKQLLEDNNTYINENGESLSTIEDEERRLEILKARMVLQEGAIELEEEIIKQLRKENSELELNSKTTKVQALEVTKAAKAQDKLLSTLEDNIKVFKKGDSQSVAYAEALSKIADAAKEVFGEDITSDFVQQNKELFAQLVEGGQQAEAAFSELGEKAATSYIESLNKVEGAAFDAAATIAAINLSIPDIDFGAHFDATPAVKELERLGYNAAQTAAIMSKLGYTVTFEKEKHWIGIATGIDYGTQYPSDILGPDRFKGVQGVDMVIGTKSSPTGGFTGVGGGGGGSSDKWSNPYDKQYNNNEKLNEELRTRSKLEREYQKLLDSTNTKASDLVNKSREQLESLERERAIRKEILSGRQKEMAAVEKKYSDLSEYASYNEEKQIIEINWKKINELDGSKDEKLTSRIEEYIAALENAQGQIDEQTDAIANIDENVKEIRDRGKDEYRDLENQIREAIENSRQKEIDELVAINESINDTNASLIESIQTTLDKQRQERENERTEEELSNKQRRLAYLQQDTSGANQMEILRLQKEIKEGQEDYTDSLIDQKINELQQQNDMAAEQRQYQIDLMQSQLEQYMESGRVWQDVYQLMTQGIGPNGIIAGSELENLLMESANFRAMSEIEKMNWLKELEDNVAKAVEWLKIGNSVSSLKDQGDLKKGDKVTFTTADNKTLTGKVNSKGQVVVDGQVYEGVYRNFDGNYVTDENYKKPKKEPSSDNPTTPVPEPETEKPKKPKLTDKIKRGVSAAIWNGNYGWGNGDTRVKRLKEVFGENDIQKKYVAKSITSGYDGHVSDYSYANMKKKFLQYKTGGLADFTGPAWLDGTKSRPEYVLNADQTKSFFRLVDVLSGLKSGPINNSQNNGDITYDIDINVESIGSDYDVEQLADKVKGLINDTARYRNNNIISIKR